MSTTQQNTTDLPLESMLLQFEHDRYKIGYAALRWAKEIKQKENLPEPIPHLIQRSLREILSGKITLEDIEKLPMAIKIAQPTAPPTVSTPTLKLKDTEESEPALTPVVDESEKDVKVVETEQADTTEDESDEDADEDADEEAEPSEDDMEESDDLSEEDGDNSSDSEEEDK